MSKLRELLGKATKGPWWSSDGLPYLFSGSDGKDYFKAARVGRFDYADDVNDIGSDGALVKYLRNNAERYAALIDALNDPLIGLRDEMKHQLAKDINLLDADGLAKRDAWHNLRAALSAIEKLP